MNKDKENRRILFTALCSQSTLTVYQMEQDGEIRYNLFQDEQMSSSLSREKLLQKLNQLDWKKWKIEAKGLVKDLPLSISIFDQVRPKGKEVWRNWIRSAGWLQATVVGQGPWGEKVVQLLNREKEGRFSAIGKASDKGLLSSEDQLRILLWDPSTKLTKRMEEWVGGNGKSLSIIFTPKLPEKRDIPGLWIEISPEGFLGSFEELLSELLEGCLPHGLLNNAFLDLLPYFQRPQEGIIKMVKAEGEEWLDPTVDELLGTVGWDTRWGKVQVLFLLVQASPKLVDPIELYPLSLAIRQGVKPTCRVMASIKENLSWRTPKVRTLLLGMCSKQKVANGVDHE